MAAEHRSGPETAAPAHAEVAVVVGRFQPFHRAHLALVRRALAAGRRCVVVIGSAHQARTPKNPFTWHERAEMIRLALDEAERARVDFLPIRDYYDQARWVRAVRGAVTERVDRQDAEAPTAAAVGHPRTDAPMAEAWAADAPMADAWAADAPMADEADASAPRRIRLVGHFKDATSEYLRDFPGWALERVEAQPGRGGTALRDALFASPPGELESTLAAIAPDLPPTTLDFIRAWARAPRFDALRHEWAMLRKYHDAWAGAPYPPVFVTVDALVRCAGHVLLIRRGRAPGIGLYATPGGFVEQRETLYQSTLRELAEETHLALPGETMARHLVEVAVFDHPDRSLRGRTITHAHYFDLGERALPEVHADDDAQSARWVPLAELPALEDRFHDDHFHLLDHFLGLTGEGLAPDLPQRARARRGGTVRPT